MRHLALLFLLLLVGVRAADRDLAGKYSGEWKSNSSGGGGAFRMNLELAADGTWKWEVTFTYAGQEVKTTAGQVKVAQSKLEGWYDFDLQGFTLRSRITGEWNGKAFEGKYQSGAADGSATVDEGVWNVAKAK
jgi:hypothetical protein